MGIETVGSIATCDRCKAEETINSLDSWDVEEDLKRLGWREGRKCWWFCPTCSKELGVKGRRAFKNE